MGPAETGSWQHIHGLLGVSAHRMHPVLHLQMLARYARIAQPQRATLPRSHPYPCLPERHSAPRVGSVDDDELAAPGGAVLPGVSIWVERTVLDTVGCISLSVELVKY